MTSEAAAENPRSGIGRASAILASGTFVSRILGLVSALVLAATLGIQGAAADAFALANQLPNNIYAIVAGGVLSAVLVPQIVRAGVHEDGGQRFINRIVTLGLVLFTLAAIIATLCAPLLVALYVQQSSDSARGLTGEEVALATAFAYWCLPQILFYALYSLLGEVLNARGVFGPFTWAPVLNNVVAIGGLTAFGIVFGGGGVADAADFSPAMIALIAGGATLGVACQALVLSLFWRRAGLHYRPEFRWRGVGLGTVGKAAGWTFASILVTQLAGIVQTRVASLAGGDASLGGGEDASLAVLRFSWLIFMLPHSIVVVSIATAYFTRMSAHARNDDVAALRRDVSSSLRTIGLIMVFASAGLCVLAYPFAAVFASLSPGGAEETSAMGNVLLAYLPGLVPFSILFILQRSFYALEDTRTPFLTQLVQVAVFVTGALLVAAQLPTEWTAVGIAASTTLAGTAQTLIAVLALRSRMGSLGGRDLAREYFVFVAAAVPAAAAGLAATAWLGAFSGGFAVSGFWPALITITATGIGMVAVYLIALTVLRSAELRSLSSPFLARLRRRR